MSRPRRALWIAAGIAFVWIAAAWVGYTRGSHLSAQDFCAFVGGMRPVGQLSGEPLERLHLTAADLAPTAETGGVRYLGISRYLNGARAVVTHTIDDSTRYLPACINALDKYGIKATIFVSTQVEPISSLWPRLEQAVGDGHEIGSHSRRHQCHWPDAFPFCFRAYTAYEIEGSRNDILQHTSQPYVWSWCYPCGNCNAFDFVHRKLARAGYIVARNYPNEAHDGHLLPDLQTYDADPYNATYTQVVQKRGGIAASGRTSVAKLNAKFDQVYQREGIYNFMSHPQWLDYGPDRFYEQHLAHLANHCDIWYVPMGPLYAYHTVCQRTKVNVLMPLASKARFVVYNDLDAKVFTNSITLEFVSPAPAQILSGGKALTERTHGPTDRWDKEYYRMEGDKLYLTIRPNTIVEIK